MASYRPKSLDELNNMYDKAISAQQAIKRGTSKINQSSSSANSFEDVINNAENSFAKKLPENEKPITDLSDAVDDFIKHFSDAPQKKAAPSAVPTGVPAYQRPVQHTQKTQPAPFQNVVGSPNPPIVSRKQSDEDMATLMSDYVRIMNDQDDADDEPKRGFHIRRKEKKKAQAIPQETPQSEPLPAEPAPTELLPEAQTAEVSDAETALEDTVSPASEDAWNDFAKQAEENENVYANESEETDPTADESQDIPDFSLFDTENQEDAKPQKTKKEKAPKQKNSAEKKGGARVFARVALSILLVILSVVTLAVGSLSTVLNVNTGTEAPGGVYFFTSSHEFSEVGINPGDLVLCEKRSSVNDGEFAVYIDPESKTFSFGIKSSGKTSGDGSILYVIGGNEVDRNNVLGTVSKTVPTLGKVISTIYSYYIPVISVLVVLCAALLLVIIFALRNKDKKQISETVKLTSEADEAQEETTEKEEAEEEQQPEDDENTQEDDDALSLFSDLD